jgi:hypothetical protein
MMNKLQNFHFVILLLCCWLVAGCGTQRVKAKFDSHEMYLGTGYPYSRVPKNQRDEVCKAVDQASDICYFGAGQLMTSISPRSSSYILLHLRQPLKPYGYLVGYASGSLDWLQEDEFNAALSRTLALREGGALKIPLDQENTK